MGLASFSVTKRTRQIETGLWGNGGRTTLGIVISVGLASGRARLAHLSRLRHAQRLNGWAGGIG
jgi:hypothetical protein